MVFKFLTNPLYLMIIFVNAAFITAIVLTLLESRLKNKAKSSENSQEKAYLRDLQILKTSKNNPEIKLNVLNGIAKNFFETEFNLSQATTYSELTQKFRKLKNNLAMEFSELMITTYYTKEKLGEKEISKLINKLTNLINQVILLQTPQQQSQPQLKQEQKQKSLQQQPPKQQINNKIIKQEQPKEEIIIEQKLKNIWNKITSFLLKEKQNNVQIKTPEQKPILKQQTSKTQPPQKNKDKTTSKIIKQNKKEKIDDLIEQIIGNKSKIDKISLKINKNNNIKQIIEKSIKTDQDKYTLFQENPETFNQIKRISEINQNSNQKFNSLFNRVYNDANLKEQNKLRTIINKWRIQKQKILKKISNPFKLQINESELLYQNFIEIRIRINEVYNTNN